MQAQDHIVGSFFRALGAGVTGTGLALATPVSKNPPLQTPEEVAAALVELRNGNRRFVAGEARLRTRPSGLGAPIAIVLCCTDLDKIPELLMDQPVGALSVIRSRAAEPSNHAMDLLETELDRWGTQLVVVLGHQGCPALPRPDIKTAAAATLLSLRQLHKKLVPVRSTLCIVRAVVRVPGYDTTFLEDASLA